MGDDPDSGLVLPLSTFDELCASRLIAEIDELSGVAVRLDDDGDAAAFAEDQLAGGRWAAPVGRTPSAVTMLDDLRQIPAVLAVVIALLGLMVGTHAMLLAVRRRGGDLVVLRALGMRPVDVRRVVTWQALALGAVAVAVGIPVGLGLGRAAWTAMAAPANVLVHLDVEPGVVAGVATLTVLLLVCASIWPGRRAGRLRLGQVERYE